MRLSASSTREPAVEALEVLGQRAQRGLRTPRGRAAPGTARQAQRCRRRTPRSRSRSARGRRRARISACLPLGRAARSASAQQPLALEPAARQPLRDPLEQHALVRDVLIDDRDALVVDRDDERVAELARAGSSAGSRRLRRSPRQIAGSRAAARRGDRRRLRHSGQRRQRAPDRAHVVPRGPLHRLGNAVG